MRVTLKLLGCAMVGLLLLALSLHHPADATGSHEPSEALADAMSSHGIELGDVDMNPAPAPATSIPVVYAQNVPRP